MARRNLLVALVSFLLILNVAGVFSATFTVINKCRQTVWPGIFSTTTSPLNTTGFGLQKDESRILTVPSSWSGRFWGRTNCSQNSTGDFSCISGDCGTGKVGCSGRPGKPPTTLAEFSLNTDSGSDFYDVSLVDGFNLPMLVVPEGGKSGNCSTTGCVVNLNEICPPELEVKSKDGSHIGCKSACDTFRLPELCCTGAYGNPSTCKPSSYSEFFKNACPLAYSYAYDDTARTFTCTSANYVITFCPPLSTINNGKKNPEANGGGQSPEAVEANNISAGGTLSPFQTITSKDGSFKLGLFTPGIYNYYIGIWYSIDRVSVQTVVWVANRDKPLKDPTSSEFKLLENGNLVLYDPSKSLIWSTNSASSTSNTTEAVLGDDGNLVIRDSSSPSVVYWQSFDHPTHTWLPGGKIGLNKKTNETQVLTSWKNPYDPSPGIFNLELDPTGVSQYLIKWNKSKVYLTSGEWSEQAKNFPLVPEMGSNDIYNFSYISNEDESYFTYNLINSSMLVRFVLDVSGQIKQYTLRNLIWSQPKQFCDVYGICGPFGNCNQDKLKCECLPGFVERYPSDWNFTDSTGGCIRNSSWQCGLQNGFSPIPTSKLPEDPQSREVNGSENCKSACQKTCSCYAYAYENTSCQLWEGDMLNIKQQSDVRAGNLYLRRADSEIQTKDVTLRKRKVAIWKIIVLVMISFATITMGALGYFYLRKKNKINVRGILKGLRGVLKDLLKTKATYNDTPITNMFNGFKTDGEEQELKIFNLASLAIATNNFCLNNKLGQGGFGPVYKGKLQNGQQIAVKRLSKSSGQGIEEFKNEVVLISKLQHRNLVKLLGCCVEGEENMLIYEYMPNKSLDAFLFDPGNKACLDWDKRFSIVGGIARGLIYLHRDSRLRVIHRDLKVSNILLDEDMIPKISDFGMARIFGGNQSMDNTSRVVGTMGYMAPEYMIGGTFSEKSDVFSFGVLVLELVSGKRTNSFFDPEQPLNLLLHAWRLWNEGKWSEIVDEDLGDLYTPSEVMKCIHIGLLCCQNRAVDRPTMSEVDLMLNYETDRPSPKEPPYSFPASSDEPGIPPIQCSNNNVTLTTVKGR